MKISRWLLVRMVIGTGVLLLLGGFALHAWAAGELGNVLS